MYLFMIEKPIFNLDILLFFSLCIYKFVPGVVISAICAVATLVFAWYTHNQFLRTCTELPIRFALQRTEDLEVTDIF